MMGYRMMELAMVAMEMMAMLSGRVAGVATPSLVQVVGLRPTRSFLRC
jgi:hypothetical protein